MSKVNNFISFWDALHLIFTSNEPNQLIFLAYELLNRQPGLIIEKILIFLENNINSSMRKILGVEGDTDYDKLSLDVICEAKERL